MTTPIYTVEPQRGSERAKVINLKFEDSLHLSRRSIIVYTTNGNPKELERVLLGSGLVIEHVAKYKGSLGWG